MWSLRQCCVTDHRLIHSLNPTRRATRIFHASAVLISFHLISLSFLVPHCHFLLRFLLFHVISGMKRLLALSRSADLQSFESLLRTEGRFLTTDPFLRNLIPLMRSHFQFRAIEHSLLSYRRVSIPKLARVSYFSSLFFLFINLLYIRTLD